VDLISEATSLFCDVDNDGDEDLFVSGVRDLFGDRVTQLYLNNNGILTKSADSIFIGVKFGSLDVADVDNDGDMDLFITGHLKSNARVAQLYLNDKGRFTADTLNVFHQVSHGDADFADIDNDGDQDLLYIGQNILLEKKTLLYRNEGGKFTLVPDTPFPDMWAGNIAFCDIDNDSDMDILLTGRNIDNKVTTKLFTNNVGIFTEVTNTSFPAIFASSVLFHDIDSDGDQDLFLTGSFSGFMSIAKLFVNHNGQFTELPDTPFEGVSDSSAAFADVDGDGDSDLLVSGTDRTVTADTRLYLYDSGMFTELIGSPFKHMTYGGLSFSDIDGDGDQDLFMVGEDISYRAITSIYLNNFISSATDLDNPNQKSIKVFPNPARSSRIQIYFDFAITNNHRIHVNDLLGRPVIQPYSFTYIDDKTIELDISYLPHGTYAVESIEGSKKNSILFIKQ